METLSLSINSFEFIKLVIISFTIFVGFIYLIISTGKSADINELTIQSSPKNTTISETEGTNSEARTEKEIVESVDDIKNVFDHYD